MGGGGSRCVRSNYHPRFITPTADLSKIGPYFEDKHDLRALRPRIRARALYGTVPREFVENSLSLLSHFKHSPKRNIKVRGRR